MTPLLGWLIIGALAAAFVILPPAHINGGFKPKGYAKELADWAGFLVTIALCVTAVLALLVLAIHLIRS